MVSRDILEKVIAIFNSSRQSKSAHFKNCFILKKIYEDNDHEEVFSAIVQLLRAILQSDFKQAKPYDENAVRFVSTFCSTLNKRPSINTNEELEEHPLFIKILDHLTKKLYSVCIQEKFRSCQIINYIFDDLSGQELSEEIFENLMTALFQLLEDRTVPVKLQSISVLSRLQDPHDPTNNVITTLLNCMQTDNSPRVRQLCVQKIAVSADVLKHILEKVADKDPSVRLAAFSRLANHMLHIKLSDRRKVLFAGFLDSSPKINNFVASKLVKSWLQSVDNDILRLMKALRIDGEERDVLLTVKLFENVLRKFYFKENTEQDILNALPIDNRKLIPFEKLDWESVSYLRILVQFLKDNNLDRTLALVVSDVPIFLDYIKEYTVVADNMTVEEFLKQQFVIKQLFVIAKTFDYSDTFSARKLVQLIKYMFNEVDLMEDTTDVVASALELVIPNKDQRCLFINGVIDDLMLCPVVDEVEIEKKRQTDLELSALQIKLHTLQENQKEAIDNKSYREADSLEHEIASVQSQISKLKEQCQEPEVKRRSDLPTLKRCLDIVCGFLLTCRPPEITPAMRMLKSHVVQDLLVHPNDVIKSKALKCYAIFSVLDKATALIGIQLFVIPIFSYEQGEECDTETLIICIKAVCDLLRIYGTGIIAEPEEDAPSESMNEEHERVFTGGISLTRLCQALVELMEDDQYEIQECAVLALSKLVLSERILSPSLISRLILKWCNPNTDNEECCTIKQFLGYVLEDVPLLPSSSDLMEDVVFITIKSLVMCSKNSPLAKVDIDNISKFLIALCKLSKDASEIHSRIAHSLCEKIRNNSASKLNLAYSKMLLMLDIPENESDINKLLEYCDLIVNETKNAAILSRVKKFKIKLQKSVNNEAGVENDTDESCESST